MAVKIAKATPFEGAPKILAPSVFGASVGKDFIYRIPVIGQRPISISAEGLIEGITFENGILRGNIKENCEFEILITAKNTLGETAKHLKISVGFDNALRTPLMGFTSWNAFASRVTQQDIENTADYMVKSGIADYGYDYVNTDSGWQKEYGGKYDAIMPNSKFPDMKKMCDKIHSLGFKAGIYSTPMLTAWGCPKEFESIPGCTRGEPDILLTGCNGGVGMEHMEENNVRQWEEWGMDYLKYDWALTDPYTADFMKRALLNSSRDISFCVTVLADFNYAAYWKKNCCSWRDGMDAVNRWDVLLKLFGTVDKWKDVVCQGHFYDLDMLEIGQVDSSETGDPNELHLKRGFSDYEKLFSYSMRAFFSSPLQLSCLLTKLSEFEFNLICNEEIIAINQDALASYPEKIKDDGSVRIYRRELENGDTAYAIFNISENAVTEKLCLPENCVLRDLWLKENVADSGKFEHTVPPHSVKILKVIA